MTINEASAQTPAAAPAAVPAFAGNHQVKPLRFNPARLHGLSERLITSHHENNYAGSVKALNMALLQTWGTAARRHPVGGLGSIGEMLIEHNHGFGQGRGSNSECSFNQAHLPHDTWLQAPCLGLSFA